MTQIRKLFTAMNLIDDAARIRLVACQLIGEASEWWEAILAARRDARRTDRLIRGVVEPGAEPMLWTEFEVPFKNQYFPEAYRERLRYEFEHLQ